MPSERMTSFNGTVKIIKYVKSRFLKNELFKRMCEVIGSHYLTLSLHAKVRWLRGKREITLLMKLNAEVTFGHIHYLDETFRK